MTNNMTYENLLDTFDSFEAHLNEIKRLQEEKAEKQKREAQLQHELEEQQKKEQAIADDKAVYECTKCANTKASYEKYLRNFANGAYRTEAKAKVDHFLKLEQEEQARIQRKKEAEAQRQREQAIVNDHQAYDSAKRTNTKAAYESYLRNHSYGLHRNEATNKLNEFLEVERVLAAQHQQELAVQQVKAQSEYNDHQAFEKAKRINTRASYTDYLTFFPNGIHKNECEKYCNITYDFSGTPHSKATLERMKKLSRVYFDFEEHPPLYFDFIEEQKNFKKTITTSIITGGYSYIGIRIIHTWHYIFSENNTYSKNLFDISGAISSNDIHRASSSISITSNKKKDFVEKTIRKFGDTFSNYEFPADKKGIKVFTKNGLYGLMKGNKVLTTKSYKTIMPRGDEKLFYYWNCDSHGLLDDNGKVIFTTSDENIHIERILLDLDYLIISKNNKYGIAHLSTSEIILYPEYYDALEISDQTDKKNCFFARKGLKSGVIDKYGNIVEKLKLRIPPYV